RRIRARRFASEMRETVRFQTAVSAHWNGRHATVRNLSIAGAQFTLPVPDATRTDISTGAEGELLLDHSMVPPLRAAVRSSSRDGPTQVVGVKFLPGQDRGRALLALALFHGGGLSPGAVALGAGP